MGDLLYYAYAGIMFLIILFFLGVLFYALYNRRQIIHFEILEEETMKPVAGMDVYGEYSYASTDRGYTASGEPVFFQGSTFFTGTKKIGKTDENGVFKKIYFMNGYSSFFFPVENPETKFPNFFSASQLQLSHDKDKIKTIVLNKDGKMKLLNPNKNKNRKEFKYKLG
jgi:hypothetical protein